MTDVKKRFVVASDEREATFLAATGPYQETAESARDYARRRTEEDRCKHRCTFRAYLVETKVTPL